MTLNFNQVFKDWREGIFRKLHVALPGYIKSWDPEAELASVQITVKFEINEEFINPPLLEEVPVRQYNTGQVIFYAPPGAGDLVDVIFTDSSIAENQQEDGKTIVQPGDRARHDLNNVYAVPRVQTAKNKHSVHQDIPGVYVEDNAKIFLGRLGGGGEEVLNLLHQTTAALEELVNYITSDITFTHSPGSPSGPPTTAPLLIPLSQKITVIKSGLENLGKIEI